MVAVSRYLASWLAIVPFVAAIDTYDVVIVGSGPGGLIAAEYLSRDPSVSVLVLEAGGPSLAASGGTDVPGYAASRGWTKFDIPGEYTGAASIFAPENAKYTIDYTDDRKLQLAQMVGGCSSVNAALYFRVPESYLTIAHWPFDANHVSAMFDELERDVYGVTDTPSTDARRYNQEAYNIVSQALKSAGFQENSLNTWDAVNHKDKTFGHAPFVIKDGLRDSPAKTCWGKMKSRSNVKLLTYAKVNYIKHTKGKANGVVYNNNQEVAVSARGAVIMGAGAIGTPNVLIQSGIGPSWQLKGLKGKSAFPGITNTYGNNGDGWVVNELVGQNLFDTTLALASFSHPQMNAFHVDKKSTDDINNYMNSRKGPLASPGPVLIAYESFVVQNREYDFQLTVLNEGLLDSRSNDRAFGAALYINNPESRDSCSFDIGTGKYRAFTANTLYMDSSRDLAAMAEFASRVASKLEGAGATFLRNKQQSIKDWAFANRQYVTNHFGGTCYASSESKRCADDKLRVVGTSNIYIADASAMKDGTVNPYGFIMYIGREAGNVVKAALANGPTTPPTVSPPTQCTLTEKDVDYTGNDIGNAPSSNANGCCAICAAKSGCGAFSWSNYNGGTCYLKSGKGAWTTKSGVTSGVVGKSNSQCSPVEANVDYSGADIGSASSGKVDGCCQLCLNKSGCNAYSWNNYNGGTCYFKSGKGNTSNKAGVYSGTVTRSNRRKHKKAEDIDIDVTEEDDEDDVEERHAKHHKATNGTVHVHIRLHKSKKKN